MIADYTMGMGKTMHLPALSPSRHTFSISLPHATAQLSEAN
jgi:hypothetical protein